MSVQEDWMVGHLITLLEVFTTRSIHIDMLSGILCEAFSTCRLGKHLHLDYAATVMRSAVLC